MRVCHVWENFWPIQIGGLERYIMNLSYYLSKTQNVDFSLITGRTKILQLTKNIPKTEDARYLKVYRLGPRPIIVNQFGNKLTEVNRTELAAIETETEENT